MGFGMKKRKPKLVVEHKFKDSKVIGDIGEKIVQEYLESINYRVSPLSVNEQKRLGYDFRARNLNNDLMYGIEVKTDVASARTGNLFIETSVDDKPGWFVKYKPSSRVIIVFVLNVNNTSFNYYKLLFVSASKLKKYLSSNNYQAKRVKNDRYIAWGFIVPVKDIAAIAVERKIMF